MAGITGAPGTHVRAALVAKGGSTIELLQDTAPDDRKTVRPRPSDVGSVHVALEVDDVEAVAEACARRIRVVVGRGRAAPLAHYVAIRLETNERREHLRTVKSPS